MKLLRYGSRGAEKPGILDTEGQIRDLSHIIEDIAGESLGDSQLAALRRLDLGELPLVESTTRIGPCVGQVGKFICIRLNYADHAAEAGMDLPAEPVIFFKATSSIIGPWLVTRDEVPDPQNLPMYLEVNENAIRTARPARCILTSPP